MRVVETCSCDAEIEIEDAEMREVSALLQQWRTHHPHPDDSPRGGRPTVSGIPSSWLSGLYNGTWSTP